MKTKIDIKMDLTKWPMSISEDRINYVLSYVKKEERRVIECKMINTSTIKTLLKCKSPTYTNRPVTYLSSSELMISTAQVGHILIDYYLTHINNPYSNLITSEMLKEFRENHEIYFIDMNFQFHNKIPATEYEMIMQLEQLKKIKDLIFGKYKFNINSKLKGSFMALLSIGNIK